MKRKIREVIKEDKGEKDSLLNDFKIKSQAAMEYLMTYGWAILIIVLALGVLYSLGVMNPKNFIPRAPPGSCFVFRPNGPGTTDFVSLQGTCGYLPMYVASFNGVNAYISASSPLLLTNGITKTAWVYIINSSITQDYRTIIDLGSPPNSIYLETGYGGFMFGAYVGSGGNAFSGATNEITWRQAKNGWYFVVQTVTTSLMEGYVNGNKVGSMSGTYNLSKGNVVPKIGGGYRVAFIGSIANVQIYNTALTPQEIQYLYQQGLGGGPVRLQNLVAWWPLNGDAKDYSGNNNHGTIYNVTFVQNYNPP
jgi:hypothetical protein